MDKYIKKIVKIGYYILFVIVCFAFLASCYDPIPKPRDPDEEPEPGEPPFYDCDYKWSKDNDCDGLTDDAEFYQKNIDLYGFDYYFPNHDPSKAVGQGSAGSLDSGILLALPDGDNYIHYFGTDGHDNKDNWGTGKLIMVLAMVAEELENGGIVYKIHSKSEFPGPIQIGDFSKEGGGYWADHPRGSHQKGLNADLRYVNKAWKHEEVSGRLHITNNPQDYDKGATHNVFLAFRDVFDEINKIIVNKTAIDFEVYLAACRT